MCDHMGIEKKQTRNCHVLQWGCTALDEVLGVTVNYKDYKVPYGAVQSLEVPWRGMKVLLLAIVAARSHDMVRAVCNVMYT